ncbi:hypothetical protein [Oceanobacillus profundus]|nr:hypothetical protein [Oceanobacillus profundus]
MYRHEWYTLHNGRAIKCDKCGAYAHIDYHDNFREIEAKEDCPIAQSE